MSLTTYQGYEWLGAAAFNRQLVRHEAMRACLGEGVACLEEWSAEAGVHFDHVYVVRGSGDTDACAGLRRELRSHAGYTIVYDGPGGTIACVRR